jgi:uncharacterized membrane protein YdbT with pleckstrin-like domain
MFCNSCGKELSTESKFCNGCGAEQKSLPTAPTAQPDLSASSEKVIFQIRPSFYSVGVSYTGAALAALILTGLIGWLGFTLLIALFFAFVAFIYPAMKHIERNRIVYTLTPNKIEIDSGLISKTVRNIPLRNAQDVTVSATIFERMLGVGDVIIDSAAEAGKITMRQIPDPRKHADLILQQLQHWR